MVHTIENEQLTLSVDSMGAQMMHICSRDGREYLWQGDPAYWPDRAPTLFPFIGRLTQIDRKGRRGLDDSTRITGDVFTEIGFFFVCTACQQ